jgi:hypothetical protein
MAKPLSATFIRKAAAYHRGRSLDENGGDAQAALRSLRREIGQYSREDPERRKDLLVILRLAVEQLQAAEASPPAKPAGARKKTS